MEKKERLEDKLRKLIESYEQSDGFNISQAYGDGGPVNPYPRLHRAVVNQIDGGDATLSRYAIWANTVRDNIIEAAKLIKENPGKSLEYLEISVNSLSCFSDIQAYFDPFEGGQAFREPYKLDLKDR